MSFVRPATPGGRVLFWLVATALVSLALNVAVAFVLRPQSASLSGAWESTAPGLLHWIVEPPSGVDSWRPMTAALLRSRERDDRDIYGLFFEERTKFQYPPTSLFFFAPLSSTMLRPEALEPGAPLRITLGWLSFGALLVTIGASIAILEVGLARVGVNNRTPVRWARIAVALALACMYYPAFRGYRIGQIQVFLNALVALGVLFHLLGWRALSGGCLGVCCLVKPQYGIMLLWSLLRRHWRFALGLGGVLLCGVVLSVAQFGLGNHVRYLDVLRTLSRQGEAFWPNQSMNGLLNRLLQNGDPTQFSPTEFAPYHPAIYAATILSSLAILVAALWQRRGQRAGNESVADPCLVVVAATMASPIAWEHHYGAFLPLFAASVPACLVLRHRAWMLAPALGLGFLAMANVIRRSDLLFANPIRGLLGSHLYFGALVFFGLLLWLRATESRSLAGSAADSPARSHEPARAHTSTHGATDSNTDADPK